MDQPEPKKEGRDRKKKALMEKVAGTTENSDANAKIKIRKLSSKLSSIVSS
jgi:hypothetical protein